MIDFNEQRKPHTCYTLHYYCNKQGLMGRELLAGMISRHVDGTDANTSFHRYIPLFTNEMGLFISSEPLSLWPYTASR